MINIQDDILLEHVKKSVELSMTAKKEFYQKYDKKLIEASKLMAQTMVNDGKILIFGNGGSAADAQHMAAEMMGRMLIERKIPLPAIALTTDTSVLTAIGNDYGYEDIFLFQVRALARKNDLIIAISTSGNSKNVLKAVEGAKALGAKIISFTGGSGGKLKDLSDINLNVDLGKHSSMIQETHITVVHLLVDLMDRFLLPDSFVQR